MSGKFKMIGLALLLSSLAGAPQAFSANSSQPAESTQQAERCTGVVYDETGEPVIGATVQVEGTKAAVNTDFNGEFNLGNQPKGCLLKVSYIGYKDAEVRWHGTPVTITLEPGENVLDEMVVVGYGVVRKADLAGSVSVLDNKAFAAQPITQASEALQGRVAGVNVVSDGIPGGSVKIRVRGSNSINNSNEPLYVVDGMVRETGLEGINPEDIASMQVLKDASSTAIYGSRGANGVVLITTKSASKGATQITFDAQVGVSNSINLPEVLSTRDYANSLTKWGGFAASDLAPYIDGSNPGTNWGDEMFRTGVTQNYRLVLAKGTEAAQIYFSANYLNNEGTLRGTEYERYTGKLNAKAKLTNWLDLTVDMQASHGVSKGVGGMEVGGYNPLWLTFNYSPSMEIMDSNGYYNWDPYCSINANPVGLVEGTKSERRRDVFAGHVDLKFNILPTLTFTTSNGVDYWNNSSYNFTPEAYNGPGKGNGASNSTSQRMLLQSVNNLTYINTFAEKHNLTVTAVWEATKSSTRALSGNAQNLLTESVGWWNLGVGATRDASNSITDWTLLSAVGRAMYNYDNRYMATVTFRADGSSRFQNKKWGYFPSVALAWTISNESFMESLRPTISNLKLRTSYGVIGNQDITPYSTIAMLAQTTAYYGNTPYTGFWSNAIATPDLRWEKTKQFDFGVDAAFMNGRFDVSIDYFYKRTSDALLLTSNAAYLGGASYYINAGEVMNAGFDFAINANIIQGKDWNWSSSLNASVLKNEVKKMTADTPELYAGSLQSIISDYTVVKEGEAIGSLFGFKHAGIDAQGYDTYYTKDGQVTKNPAFEDRVVLGKASPDFTLGWNNTVTYKNWSLNAFFNGQFGMQRLNALRFAMENRVGNSRQITSNVYAPYINQDPSAVKWSEIGLANPALPDNQAIGESSRYVENASYFRLENLSLAYDFAKSVTRFADIRVSFSVQNLFTITSYKGSNPASFPFSNQGDRSNGIDTGTYPTNRTWTVGVRMNF